MSPEKLRPFFNKPARYNVEDGYIDFDVTDRCPKGARRLFQLTYDIQRRRFWALMRRSETSESDFNDGVYVPAKFARFLSSLLTPEEYSGLIALSLTYPADSQLPFAQHRA